jgi:hypothetical protein
MGVTRAGDPLDRAALRMMLRLAKAASHPMHAGCRCGPSTVIASATTGRHAPRMRGIQYAAAYGFDH